MLGAIIGDIIGSRFEFDETPAEGFELFGQHCSYTDDTICTVAIADAILNGRSYKEALLDWCRRYPEPMGAYGSMFQQWIHSANPQPYNSYGNGSAMRVSAVGWLFDDYHDVMREARNSAIVSHGHREGIKGAQCVATLIYWLRTVRITKNEVEHAVRKNFGYEIPPLRDIYKIGHEGHFDGICQETVPWAIRCFLDSQNFEDAIRTAVMARGDTDTKAAICGSIAEAYYEVPEEMIERVYDYLPDDMLQVIEQFYTRIQTDIKG
ncbi:ADP-ribosylglycohydrolase family protein [Prevotella sp. kh1p2]|uniref:ADP-ribosylglycohydrolase family protein n=1 Tax=Prevotella sp. kh1p2 TaxID=1761883 RepID=UPI0008D0427E|nr:ADP-ribosylglycohydrolase family protein [Prevotella sp. kh1p2]SES86228.1 ADP-ribosylglycohydrolase [Prevotella sp. kh1p2]SNU11083.1 ADP-ribosylglycohydrolase [Prevotellaceae bacterium KH2P17]